jgi:anaerobic magnesium-protoporphyrin IX monomethyl ester cyclase
MVDVVLVHPIADPQASGAPRLPLGVLCVAGPVDGAGYRVQVIDQQVDASWEQTLERALAGRPLCVGISAMTGNQIRYGLAAAALVRAASSVPIVWGGVHPSLLPEQTAADPLVDIVVFGEGEETFLEVVRRLEVGRTVEGVAGTCFKAHGTVHANPGRPFLDLDRLAPLPYHLVDVERYITADDMSERTLELPTSRGCPHRCGFCYNLDRLTDVVQRFRLTGINFREDNFFTDRSRVEAVCRGILERGLAIGWHADCRCDYFARYPEGFLRLLRESGLRALTFGAESGSQRTLDAIGKDISVADILTAARRATRLGLIANFHFMTGFPGETEEDLFQTYRLIRTLLRGDRRRHIYGPALYTPYPGTSLYDRCLELGLRPPGDLAGWADYHWQRLNLPWLSPTEARFQERAAWVAEHASAALRPFYRWWFVARLELLIDSGRVGPLPERWLLAAAKELRRRWRGFLCGRGRGR